MCSEPEWQTVLKWVGVGLAIGIGIIYYAVTNSPAKTGAPPVAETPTAPPGILQMPIGNTPIVLQKPRLAVGSPAPDFSLPTLDQTGPLSLSQFQEQPVLIN